MPAERKPAIPEAIRPQYEAISEIIDPVCREHLNEEYAQLARKLAETLAREHPALLEKGHARSWAAAIVYALGRVNFLFDKSQTPHLSATALCERFGVSTANASPKARKVFDAVGLFPFHPEWTLPSLMARSPLVWMIEVNGIPMDARMLPREIQEEAYRLGLIPYLPE
ncbi:DUF6398 domain-containing protein [Rhodocaloribacter sp.]